MMVIHTSVKDFNNVFNANQVISLEILFLGNASLYTSSEQNSRKEIPELVTAN